MKTNLLLPIILLFSFFIQAQSWVETTKVTAPERLQNAEFGKHVAIHGDYAIVGMPTHWENNIVFSGIVHIYERNATNDWEFKQSLLPDDVQVGDNFGFDVDIEGDYAIISANEAGNDDSDGALYIYKRDNFGVWNMLQYIQLPVEPGGNFGNSLSFSGNYIAVSKVHKKVHIYERDGNNTWNLVQSVENFETEEFEEGRFGIDTSLKGNTLVVGDDEERSTAPSRQAGAVYVYERDINGVWNDVQKITPESRTTFANFGASVSINENEDIIVVGSPDETFGDTDLNQGTTYIFNKTNDNWSEHQRLEASNSDSFKKFGNAVAIEGNTVMVGSPQADFPYTPTFDIYRTGAIYRFTINQNSLWNEVEILYPSHTNQGANLGYVIDFQGNTLITGAPFDPRDENNSNSLLRAGAAYFFQDSNTLNVQVFEQISDVKLYPNPTSGVVNIKFNKPVNEGKIILRNVLGQQIHAADLNNTDEFNLDITDSSGIYILEVYYNKSKKEVFRIIKT